MYLEIYFILFIFAVYVYPITCIDNNNNNETQFLFQLHKAKLPKKDTRLRKLFPNMTMQISSHPAASSSAASRL